MFLLMPTICRASKAYCPNLDRVSLKSQTTFITITIIITTIITITTLTTDLSSPSPSSSPEAHFHYYMVRVNLHSMTCLKLLAFHILSLATYSIFCPSEFMKKPKARHSHQQMCMATVSDRPRRFTFHTAIVLRFGANSHRSKKTHKILDWTDKCF